MSEARRSTSAVDGMPRGLRAPDQVEKIAQIYRVLGSHAGEHLLEENMTLMWAALSSLQVPMCPAAILSG